MPEEVLADDVIQIVKILPMIWKRLFEECKHNGFNEKQAFELTKIFVDNLVYDLELKT